MDALRHRLTVAALALPIAGAAGAAPPDRLVIAGDQPVEISVDQGAASAPPASESMPLGPAQRPPFAARGDGEGVRAARPALGDAARIGWSLAAVILLIVVLRFALRRFGGPLSHAPRPAGVIDVLARYPFARAQQLVLLRVAGRVLLLHQTKTGLTALSEMTDADEIAALAARIESAKRDGAAPFQGFLQRLSSPPPSPGDDSRVVVDLTRRPRRSRGAQA